MEIKYDRIGVGYNQTRQADPYLTARLIEHLNPAKDKIYLDIGCGTGNYTCAFQQKGFRFLGIDPSEKMLAEAKIKNDQVVWSIGTAENTNLERASIDGIIACLTIHHWPDLQRGFSELNRILKGNGRIVLFTSTPEQMNGYWLKHYFPKMFEDSKKQMPSFATVREAMHVSGFEITGTEKYFVRPDLQDHFLYCGKNNPELYLRPEVRNGISSFSDLANQQEIQDGLARLQADIALGSVQTIIDAHQNDEGDYLFIFGKKAGC